MQAILSFAVVSVLILSLLMVLRWGKLILIGEMPARPFAFFAILFTSGLDVGLIMLPLTEFPTYETDETYSFTNPLAIEFGFWGFFIWIFYFLTTCYFCIIEPRLKLFEIGWVKFVNNIVIIGTCAFTGFLFLQYLPDYFEGITPFVRFAIVAIVLMGAVFSSTDIRYVKILSLASTWLFFALIAVTWVYGGLGLSGVAANLLYIGDYFPNIYRFVLPFSDFHAFYLFWWFAWSIMIGQFVSRFVGGIRTWHLLIALLVIPSIPIALWFSVLFGLYEQGIDVSTFVNSFMIMVGVVFVINSLDSLTRLYSENLQLTVDRLGKLQYIGTHWSLLYGLILLYQFTPLQIEWVGLVVIGLYVAISILILLRRKLLLSLISTS